MVDSYYKNATCLIVDNIAGARYATDHLLDLGHTRIGFINGLMRYHSSRDRLQGYKCALTNRSLPFEESLIVESEFSRADGFKAMEILWNRDKSISAIFAASDLQAIGVIKYLSTQGVRVPEDVSVVGFDNIEMTELIELTTVSQPMNQMGKDAMQILVKYLTTSAMKGGDTPLTMMHKTYTPSLVMRKSTMPKQN